MIDRLGKSWIALWFQPASRTSFVATRAIVGLYALWLVLSRPMLWAVTNWTAPLIPERHPLLLARFGLFVLPGWAEHVLYRILPLLLVAVILGFVVRIAAFAAALLLYHFGPLEEFFAGIFSNGHSGFAFAVFALLVLAFADDKGLTRSEEYRWPVVMIQSLLAMQYFLGGLSKIRFTGITWYSGPNISATADQMATLTGAPWGHAVAQSAALSWAVAIATLLLELLFPLAIVSRRARWILVPAAIVAHILRTRIYGLYFVGWPLLALFVNWDRVLEHVPLRRPALVSSVVEE